MLSNLLALLRQGLRRTGFDIVRLAPDPRRFEPHERIWLRRQKIRTVIDVGAHEGEFVQWARQALPDARIVAVEPLDDCGRALERLAARDPRLEVVHCAAGAALGELVIHKNAYSMASSLRTMAETHRAAFPFAATVVSDKPVTVKPLDSVVALPSLETPLLVKIDVQGYEREVIAGAPAILRLASIVIIEVSFTELYEGQALFEEVADSLRALRFRYSGNLWQLRDPRDGSVLQADAVFVREQPIA